jgi:hypothetical protein
MNYEVRSSSRGVFDSGSYNSDSLGSFPHLSGEPINDEEAQPIIGEANGRQWLLSPKTIANISLFTAFFGALGIKIENIRNWDNVQWIDGSCDLTMGSALSLFLANNIPDGVLNFGSLNFPKVWIKLPVLGRVSIGGRLNVSGDFKRKFFNSIKRHIYKPYITTTELSLNYVSLGIVSKAVNTQLTYTSILSGYGFTKAHDIRQAIMADQADNPENLLTDACLPMVEGDTRNLKRAFISNVLLLATGVIFTSLGIAYDQKMGVNSGVFCLADVGGTLTAQLWIKRLEHLLNEYRKKLNDDPLAPEPRELKWGKKVFKVLNLLFPLLEGALLGQHIFEKKFIELGPFALGGIISGLTAFERRHRYQHCKKNTERELEPVITRIKTCFRKRYPAMLLNAMFLGGVGYWGYLMTTGTEERDREVGYASLAGLVGGYGFGSLDKVLTPSMDPVSLCGKRIPLLRHLLNSLAFMVDFPLLFSLTLLMITSVINIDRDDVTQSPDEEFGFQLTAYVLLLFSVGLNLAQSERVEIEKHETLSLLADSQMALVAALYMGKII